MSLLRAPRFAGRILPSFARSEGGHPSLVRRLVVLATAWSLAVLAVTGFGLSILFSKAAIDRFDQTQSELVDSLVAGTSVDDAGEIAAPALTDQRALRASGRYWEIATVTELGGLKAVATSRSLWDSELAPPPGGSQTLAKKPGKTLFYDSTGPQHEPLRVAALLGRLEGVKSPLVFLAAEDRTPVDRDVRGFATITALALLGLGVGLIAVVFIQVRVGLAPLFNLRREVTGLRTGKTERVVGPYPRELEPLAEELNALMAHNLDVVERQRTHVGNLAHALKTPLSVMLTEAAQQPGQLGEVVTNQAQIMRQHVDHHLRRARAAARTQGQRERTPLEPVLDELARTLERIFLTKRVDVDWETADGLTFLGERQDLMEMVGNLMENGCKWCRGRVRVNAEAVGPRLLRITVEDDGAGLPPERRDEVMKRGARLDENAPGSGLGLSIVDELARAYDGAVDLGESKLGGLRVELTLPRAET